MISAYFTGLAMGVAATIVLAILLHAGARTRPRRPMPGSIASGWRRRIDGTVERR